MANKPHKLKYNQEQYSNSKNRELIDCECSYCNQNFQRTKHNLYVSLKRGQKDLFCSKECNTNFQTPLDSTTGQPCKNCQKPVKHPNIFCSQSCAGTFNNSQRSPEKIELTCSFCQDTYLVLPHQMNFKTKNHFCSKTCRLLFQRKPKKNIIPRDKIKRLYPQVKKIKFFNIELVCEECDVIFSRRPRQSYKNKSGKFFCSRSCRMTYFNKHHHINNGCCSNKSFPEAFIFQQLTEKFKELHIIRNERRVLKCGYEIDIYFPDLKFGIEVNGPVHYMPIFGEEKLQHVQFKDSIKYQEMNDLGISFLVIDVSMSLSKKKMSAYLYKQLEENIFPLLESKIELRGNH